MYPQILKHSLFPENRWSVPNFKRRWPAAACQRREGQLPTQRPPLPWPGWRNCKPLFFPLSCSAYEDIKLLSLAGVRNEPSVLERIIKGPPKIDAVCSGFQKSNSSGKWIFSSFFFFFLASSQSRHQEPILFLVKSSKYKSTQGWFMAPHTNYLSSPTPKQIFIEHLLHAGPQSTQLVEWWVPTLKGLKPRSRRHPGED